MNQSPTLDQYLYGNDLYITIYRELKKNYPNLFEYEQFFVNLDNCYTFFEDNQENYYLIETEFGVKIQLEGLQRYVFLYYLIMLIEKNHESSHVLGLVFHPAGRQSYEYIVEIFHEIQDELFPEEDNIKIEEQETPLFVSTNETQLPDNALDDYSNSRVVLIYYYFLKGAGLEVRRNINISTVAKFIHLVTGKTFTTIQNSEFNKKLQKAPNFKSDKELIKDLEAIKPLFQQVELNDIVKLIDAEIEIAKKEDKPVPK